MSYFKIHVTCSCIYHDSFIPLRSEGLNLLFVFYLRVSTCFILFYFIFTIKLYHSSADFSGLFRLMANHLKPLMSPFVRNLCFLKFRTGGFLTRCPLLGARLPDGRKRRELFVIRVRLSDDNDTKHLRLPYKILFEVQLKRIRRMIGMAGNRRLRNTYKM